MPRSTETLSLRMSREEISELRRRASDSGCSLNAYLRDRLSREHEDTSAAVALAARLSETRFELLESLVKEIAQKVDALQAEQTTKFTGVGAVLRQLAELIQKGK